MGDADGSYNFREAVPMVEALMAGADLCMGSRFKGGIAPGAMPWKNRYIGNPILSAILRVFFRAKISDAHCGMRALTRSAFDRLRLTSTGMEFASEMVLKSVHLKLRTAEVPVRFLKDREGRLSHHKRSGWFSPWHAAWINLRAMFIYGADFFVLRPGLLLLAAGLSLTLPLTFGPVRVGRVEFSLYWMLAGFAATLLGLQGVYLGSLARVLYDFTGTARHRLLAMFPYTRTVVASGTAFVAGIALTLPLVAAYVRHGLSLPEHVVRESHQAVTGLLLIIAGFLTFVFTLLLHATSKLANQCYGPAR